MQKLAILCVDDEEVILESLEAELSLAFQDKYELEFCSNPIDALELAEELELAVVISDYIMPQMTGDELLIKLNKQNPKAKKLMLTGQSRMDGVSRAINHANLYRYLEKPWDGRDLIMTIRQAVQSYRDEQQLKIQNEQLLGMNEKLESQVLERTQDLENALRKL
ncbi:MAG: DNA-binding NtrC family response regulator [Flammeovirgaceae bacterium]|jgi:two-component system sensor histidine kinase/response regulator